MLIISFMLVILILFFYREWYYKDKLDADTVWVKRLIVCGELKKHFMETLPHCKVAPYNQC